MNESSTLINSLNIATSKLFATAQDTVLYRPSVAYVLQHVKSFINVVQKLKKVALDPMQVRAIERFISNTNSFNEVVQKLGKNWVDYYLNVPSTTVHETVEQYRRDLIDILNQLGFQEIEKIIKFDQVQDAVNRVADLQYFKSALREYRSKSIELTNGIDLQQVIEQRLRSINSHLPSKSKHKKTLANAEKTSETVTRKLEEALDQFKDIDIPDDDLLLDESLGTGGFGTVYRGTRLSTGELLAVKEMRNDKITMGSWTSLFAEIATMANLKNRYVLELVGTHITKPYRIITRYCSGKSLFDRLHRFCGNALTPLMLTKLAYQVARGMAFLHHNGIVHRDLKTMNILLDDEDAALIADFGLCGLIKDNKELIGGVGTPHYTAPEVLSRQKYGPRVDSYSYGVILWEMATGQIPFRDKTQAEIIDHVVTHGWRLKIPSTVPECLRKLILKCWSANPNDRPEFDEIVEMFESGKVKFADSLVIKSKEMLEASGNQPPLNIKYISQVFKDPSNPKFNNVVDFVVNNLSPMTRSKLQVEDIVSTYTATSNSPGRVLLVASELLTDEQFEDFVNNVASPILQKLNDCDVQYGIRFMISVPLELQPKLEFFHPRVLNELRNGTHGFIVLQLIAVLGDSAIQKYKADIISFLTAERIAEISDQKTVDAVIVIVTKLINEIKHKSMFIQMLESSFIIPSEFQRLLAANIHDEKKPRLLKAVIKLSMTSDTSMIIPGLLKSIPSEEIEKIAQDVSIYDILDSLLRENKNIRTAFLALFAFFSSPEIPPLIANHKILTTLLSMEGHTQRKLQILTELFASPGFVENTSISDALLKQLITAMSDEKLNAFALKLIAALSMHKAGCKFICDTNLMFLFSQLFLSPMCGDTVASMLILRNIAKANLEIPQVSLIISCLMQDLINTRSKKVMILDTLVEVVRISPESVQPIDLQTSVLSFLSPNETPEVVYKVLHLFNETDTNLLKSFYERIIDKIMKVLATPELQYIEIIGSAVDLIILISINFDIASLLIQSGITDYVEKIISQDLPECDELNNLRSSMFVLSRFK